LNKGTLTITKGEHDENRRMDRADFFRFFVGRCANCIYKAQKGGKVLISGGKK
jgi:hypothetical protein